MEIYLVFKKWKSYFLIYIDFPFTFMFISPPICNLSIHLCIHPSSNSFYSCYILFRHYRTLESNIIPMVTYFKMSTLCKAIYRFNAILIKISILIFIELQLIHLECGCNWKNLNFQSNLGIKRTKLKFYAPWFHYATKQQ